MKTYFRYTLLSLALLAGAFTAQAQVKIGNNPTSINPGSVLELESTNKGLLMPRISLTNTTTWGLAGTATAGMHVYNTNTAITSTNTTYPTLVAKIGEYYWDGTGWVALAPQGKTSSLVYAGSKLTPGTIVPANTPGQVPLVTNPSYDPFNGYSAGTFTVPFTGWFVISHLWSQQPSSANNSLSCNILVDGNLLDYTNSGGVSGGYYPDSGTITVHLNQGQVISFTANACNGCTAGSYHTVINVYQTITTFQ